MSLSVKDPEVYELAKAISQETGESMTKVVKDALKEKLATLKNQKSKASMEELLEIGRRFSKTLKRPVIDHAEYLYDERGLPK